MHEGLTHLIAQAAVTAPAALQVGTTELAALGGGCVCCVSASMAHHGVMHHETWAACKAAVEGECERPGGSRVCCLLLVVRVSHCMAGMVCDAHCSAAADDNHAPTADRLPIPLTNPGKTLLAVSSLPPATPPPPGCLPAHCSQPTFEPHSQVHH
jgi:hypothetical protein